MIKVGSRVTTKAGINGMRTITVKGTVVDVLPTNEHRSDTIVEVHHSLEDLPFAGVAPHNTVHLLTELEELPSV